MTDTVPNIAGCWKYTTTVFRRLDPQVKPKFTDIFTNTYNVKIEQKNNYFIITVPASPPIRPGEGYLMGYFNKIYTNNGSYWQLVIADFDDDGTTTLTISEYLNGKPSKMFGAYVESGYSPLNVDQNQAVSGIEMVKLY